MSSMSGGASTRQPSERVYRQYSVDGLQPHPLNKKLYHDDKKDSKFLESIKNEGILTPLLIARMSFNAGVSYKDYIISGHRRWIAAKTLGAKKVPCIDLTAEGARHYRSENVDVMLEVERAVIEANRQRIKTPEQKAREFKELKRIEKALAKERESARKSEAARLNKEEKETAARVQKDHETFEEMSKRAKAGDVNAKKKLKELKRSLDKLDKTASKKESTKAKLPEWGSQSRDKAAAAVGLKPKTAEKLEHLVDAADEGDKTARENLDKVNQGKMSVNAAALELQQERRRKGFRKNFPEYANKDNATVDAAIAEKFPNPTQLRKSMQQSLSGVPAVDSQVPPAMGDSTSTTSLQKFQPSVSIQETCPDTNAEYPEIKAGDVVVFQKGKKFFRLDTVDKVTDLSILFGSGSGSCRVPKSTYRNWNSILIRVAIESDKEKFDGNWRDINGNLQHEFDELPELPRIDGRIACRCHLCGETYPDRETVSEHAIEKHDFKKANLHYFLAGVNEGRGTSPSTLSVPRGSLKDAPLFERLWRKVGFFLPAYSDGEEHVFVSEMELALKTQAITESEIFNRSILLRHLKEASEAFALYAKKLEEEQKS